VNNFNEVKNVLKVNKVCFIEEDLGVYSTIIFKIKGVGFSVIVLPWDEGFKTISLTISDFPNITNLVRTVLDPLSDEELLYLKLTNPKLELVKPCEFLSTLRDLLK
jgi:hypothetical protein